MGVLHVTDDGFAHVDVAQISAPCHPCRGKYSPYSSVVSCVRVHVCASVCVCACMCVCELHNWYTCRATHLRPRHRGPVGRPRQRAAQQRHPVWPSWRGHAPSTTRQFSHRPRLGPMYPWHKPVCPAPRHLPSLLSSRASNDEPSHKGYEQLSIYFCTWICDMILQLVAQKHLSSFIAYGSSIRLLPALRPPQ